MVRVLSRHEAVRQTLRVRSRDLCARVAPRRGCQPASVPVQALGAASTLAYSFAASYLILKLLDAVIGLRVGDEAEETGLDLSLHGERVE